ncbi:NmrA family protein [Colletotrichum asianum]
MSLGSIHGTRCSGQMSVFFAKTARIWISRLSIKVAPQLTYVTGSPLSSKIFCAIRCSTGREPGPSSGGVFDDGNSGNKPRKRIIIGVVGNNNLGVWEGRLKLRFLRVVAGGQAQFSRRRFAGQELRKRSSDVPRSPENEDRGRNSFNVVEFVRTPLSASNFPIGRNDAVTIFIRY